MKAEMYKQLIHLAESYEEINNLVDSAYTAELSNLEYQDIVWEAVAVADKF